MKKIVAYRCVCVPQLNWRAITITEEDRSLSSAVSHSLFLKMAPAVPLDVRVKSSVVSGIIEVLATHPLDFAKTIMQNDKGSRSKALADLMKQPYKGVSSRLVGIVPMRVLFWNSITFFRERGYNPVLAGVYTAIAQTSVDFPIEQIKTQKMLNNNHNLMAAFRQPNLLKGFGYNLARNAGFAIVLNCCIDGHDGSYYHGAVGGFVGAVLTHPLDSLKTHFQAGNTSFPSHWTMANYWRGWHVRAGISLISMNIGWFVFSKLSQYLREDAADVRIQIPSVKMPTADGIFLNKASCDKVK